MPIQRVSEKKKKANNKNASRWSLNYSDQYVDIEKVATTSNPSDC